MKTDGNLGRNRLKGAADDAVHADLCGAAKMCVLSSIN
jgi:hypothetical protein